jgi:PAS domain S-box-containing protein
MYPGMDSVETDTSFVTFLRAKRGAIVAEWERRVRALPPAADLGKQLLIDHLPIILDEIANAADAALAGEAPSPLQTHPDRHAIARLHQGYELGHVVTEYSLLRETIHDLYALEGTHPAALRVFNHVLDGAIRQAVHRYAQASHRMLKALDRISMLAFTGRDESQLLHTLLEVIIESAPAVDEVTILLKHGDRLYVRESVGLAMDRDANFSVAVSEGFAGTVAARREPLFVRSAETDPLVRSPYLRRRGIKALYGVPLMDAQEVIGVAHMGSVTAYEFLDEDMFLFRAMANRASHLINETRLKEQVRAKADELESVLASARIGTFSWDPRLDEQRWDAHTRFIFGLLPDEPATRDRFLELVAPEDRERVVAAVNRSIETGNEYRISYRVIRPDGQERYVAARGAVTLGADQHPRFRGTVQDRTDEEYAERERELFLAALGHDLRGPLTAITLAASSLLHLAALPQAAVNTVLRIGRSGERMTRLISQLLDFARARAGQPLVLTPRRLDLRELWHHALDEVALSEPARRIALTSDGNTFGEWDPDRMLQLFQNLVGNALHYGDATRPITITLRGQREEVACDVHNYGEPIPPTLLPVLFDPFRRGHHGGVGLGLGLYIARQIVAAHGGSIEGLSSADEGTTFRVVVPRRPVSVSSS